MELEKLRGKDVWQSKLQGRDEPEAEGLYSGGSQRPWATAISYLIVHWDWAAN